MDTSAGKYPTVNDLVKIEGQEIVVTRVVDAPRDRVFKVFSLSEHFTHWWGPRGFRTTTHDMDFRPGGIWRFTMHGPDGTNYNNRVEYLETRAPEFISYIHGTDERRDWFRVFVSFDELEGKTRLTLRMVWPTPEERAAVEKGGAVEGGIDTTARLAELIAAHMDLVSGPRIESHPARTLVGIQERYTHGTRQNIPLQWMRFAPLMAGIPNRNGSDSFAAVHNYDPSDGSFDYLSAVQVENLQNLPDDFTALTLPEQRYAVFTHLGHVSQLPLSIQAIWSKLLPESGLAAVPAPMLERYTEEFCPERGYGGMEILMAVENE